MKRMAAILVCLCLCMGIYASCAENAHEDTGYTGIISAMDVEMKDLLELAEIEHTDHIGGMEYHVGTLCGQKVVITKPGIGKTYAAAGTATMLNTYPISSVIFTGLAGGIRNDTKVLDVVIATELVQHDYGFKTESGFDWAPDLKGIDDSEEPLGYSFCDEELVKLAYKAAVDQVGEEHAFKGLVASGDLFVSSEAYVDWLDKYFGAIACEMEGASVAAVCERYKVPFVVIRCLSDKADGKAHESINNMNEIAAAQSAGIVTAILEAQGGNKKRNKDEKTGESGEPTNDDGEKPVGSYTTTLFDNTRVHSVEIRIANEDWMDLLANPVDKTRYHAGVVIDGEELNDVSVATKGNHSLLFPVIEGSDRFSFKIRFGQFAKGQTYRGLDVLNLNNLYCDNTKMKDAISYELFCRSGIQAPLASFVWLTVNGEDRGLYLAVEETKKAFLQRAFEGNGVIYNPEEDSIGTLEQARAAWENGLPVLTNVHGADLVYRGENRSEYADILENAETDASLRDDRRVIRAVRSLSAGDRIESFFDTDEIIRYFAVHNFLLNYDSYTGYRLRNYLLYEKMGKIAIYPWDYNLAFGTFVPDGGSETLVNAADLVNTGIDTPLRNTAEEKLPLWGMVRNHPEYLEKYHEAMDTLVKDQLLSGEAKREIDRIHDIILPYVQKDTTAFCSFEEFEDACLTLKQFCDLRAESVRRQLAGELATDSGQQDESAMADVTGLDLTKLGAFTIRKGE